MVQVLQTAKYRTGEPATFEQGDWNFDGVFDEWDIIVAMATGNYLKGSYASTLSKGNDIIEATTDALPVAEVDALFAV